MTTLLLPSSPEPRRGSASPLLTSWRNAAGPSPRRAPTAALAGVRGSARRAAPATPATSPTRRTAVNWSTSPPSSAAPGCWSTTRARWVRARCRRSPTSTRRRTCDSWRSTWSRRMALTAGLLPQLRRHGGVVLNIRSDAAVEAYETWGGYGSSKAGLDHASRVLAAEEPEVAGVRRRPGRHADPDAPGRVPGEDISDRPEPTVVVSALPGAEGALPSGRYRAPSRGRRCVLTTAAATEGGSAAAVSEATVTARGPRAWPRRGQDGRRHARRTETAGARAPRCGWSPATCSS